ncbi:MAG: carboxylating nicotinate-nucleotide diphosphorylase [Planctomycetota bacterium]
MPNTTSGPSAAPAWTCALIGWCCAAGLAARLDARRAEAAVHADEGDARRPQRAVGAAPTRGSTAQGAAWPRTSPPRAARDGASLGDASPVGAARRPRGCDAITPRDLRGIEGVGAGLAVDLARFLWRRSSAPGGGWDDLESIPGLGPLLASRVRAAFAPTPIELGRAERPVPEHWVPKQGGGRLSQLRLDSLEVVMNEVRIPERPSPDRASVALAVERVVLAALAEDLGCSPSDLREPGDFIGRDVTTRTAVPAAARATATLLVKGTGVLAGLDVFERAVRLVDPDARFERAAADGARVAPGDVVARIEGRAQALLVAERTALNLLQRLSGVASMTARCVALAAGRARILDTRKTTPGLRLLEKAAVVAGGGENHRIGLFDEAMVKENHVELAGRTIPEVLAALRRDLGPRVRITCEARDAQEAYAAVLGDADVVLLDNMSAADMAALAPELRERAAARGRTIELEASGGVNERSLPAIAASGVDRVSIGALTHSAPALDISLELMPVHVGGTA